MSAGLRSAGYQQDIYGNIILIQVLWINSIQLHQSDQAFEVALVLSVCLDIFLDGALIKFRTLRRLKKRKKGKHSLQSINSRVP